MTARRNAREVFDVDKANLAERIREILREDPVYRGTVERVGNGTLLFATNVKPSFWLLGTDMHVALKQDELAPSLSTVVDVATVSQPYIFGDVFGFYNRYINGFLTALRRRVEGLAGPRDQPPYRS